MKKIRYPYTLVFLSIPACVAGTMGWFGVFTFVNGYLVKELSCSNHDWTLATLWFTCGIALWQFVSAELSAKIGRRATISFGMIVTAIGYALLPFATEFKAVAGILFFLGFAIAANGATFFPLVVKIGRSRPGHALAVMNIVSAFVGMFSLIFGGLLISSLTFQKAFFIFALLFLVCAILFFRLSSFFSDTDRERPLGILRLKKKDFRGLFTLRFLTLILLGYALEPFNYHSINQLFPNIARDLFGMGEGTIGILVGLGRIPAIAVLLFLSRKVDRMNIRLVYGTVLVAAGFCVSFLGLAPYRWLLLFWYYGFYLFHGAVWATNSVSVNASVDPRLTDAAFVVMSTVGMGAVIFTGAVHATMLNAGMTLPRLFFSCGLIAAAGGALLILVSLLFLQNPRSSYNVRER
jgi:predicted MFS family arabinose efflux permease